MSEFSSHAEKLSAKLSQKRSASSEDPDLNEPNLPHMSSSPNEGNASETLTNLVGYRDQVGHTLSFTITGSVRGPVWGTNVYSDDSHPAAAAVHAVVVRVGETKALQIQMLPGTFNYQGTIRNGVISSFYGAWEGSYAFVETAISPAMVVPNLQIYRGYDRQHLAFAITGSTEGIVWGTDIYSDDSNLATAAVHAGIVTDGQTKIVHIQIRPGQPCFQGSTRNAVTTMDFDVWPGSFCFTDSRDLFQADIPDAKVYRNRVGEAISFVITGRSAGSVWGSGIYADDSDVGVAAVHAGVIKSGETRTVIVHILPGQLKYEGSTQNGITSASYGIWAGSFTFLAIDAHN